MNNYQLYRTNVLLGGQMKWDLILDYDNDDLVVSDFHLTPISNVTPYTYVSDEYLLNNTHQDNVKAYYNKTKSYFYSECLESGFTHNWPLICNEGDVLNAYSNTYDMGCRRSKHYNLYKKQFEFFCPLWLEKVDGGIKFIITIKPSDSDTILATKTLNLNFVESNNTPYHNKFVQYLKNYFDNAGITNGNDDVLNVSFKKNNAYMHGLDVSTGLFQTRYLYDFVDNITHRERPLMETDYMITHSFCDKNMICKQLYNFNLCFNLDDIFSNSLIGMDTFYGEKVCINIETKIGNDILEKRDFYTEYNHVDKIVFGEDTDNIEKTYNVLNYLRDNKYIDFVNKNKFCQSICHWSLADNNDYIFNVYEGFSGLYWNGEKYYENLHQYGEAPNILLQNYSEQQNTNGWIDIKYDVNFANFIKYLVNPKFYMHYGTDMNTNINYIKNIKYKFIPPFVDNNGKKYVLGICLTKNAMSEFEKNISVDNTDDTIYKISLNSIINGITSTNDTTIQIFKIGIGKGKEVYLIDRDSLILIVTGDKNMLSFRNFSNIITSYNTGSNSDKNQTIILLKMLFKNVIMPEFIVFNKSLQYINALSPDTTKSEEITYFKDDNSDTAYNYVIRYDGKIKPTFTNTTSTLYVKDYVSNNSESENGSKLQNSDYTKYDTTKFEPLYPSVNYCAIKSVDNWDYNNVPTCTVTEHINPVDLIDTKYEYTWFNKNICYVLFDNLTFGYIKDKNTNINDIIKKNIQHTYNISDENLLNYIFNLYEIYECTNSNTSDDNTYTLSIKLK